MRAPVFAAFAASALAAAAPQANPNAPEYNFAVSKFVFGCTTGCYWSFDLKVEGEGTNHPAVPKAVTCEGGLDEDTDYVQCGQVSDTQTLSAYIEKATNLLKLQYKVQVAKDTSVYYYYGEQKVYAATSDQADLQEPSFTVPETTAAGTS